MSSRPSSRRRTTCRAASIINTLQLTAPGAQIYAADTNDYGPRIGISYDLFGNGHTVVGGGYGIYYQPYPLQSFFGDTIFANINVSTTLNQSTTPGLSYPLPPLVGGATPAPNRTAIDPDKKTNYNHQFTANIQQQLGDQMSLRAAYVGNRTRNNPRNKPGNLIDPALGRRPDTRYAQYTLRTFDGTGDLQRPAAAAEPPHVGRPVVRRRLHLLPRLRRHHLAADAVPGPRLRVLPVVGSRVGAVGSRYAAQPVGQLDLRAAVRPARGLPRRPGVGLAARHRAARPQRPALHGAAGDDALGHGLDHQPASERGVGR